MTLLEKIIEIIRMEMNTIEPLIENLEHAKLLIEKAIEDAKKHSQSF